MLWIGMCELLAIVALFGLLGGFLMAVDLKRDNKFNRLAMEEHWRRDIGRLNVGLIQGERRMNELESKISTITGYNPVNNSLEPIQIKGYNDKRQI